MKKVLFLLFLLLLSLSLRANACFEEVENAALSTIAAFSSVPKLTLTGVTVRGGEDELIPERIEYRNSDLSLYLEDLSTKPSSLSFWESALYGVSQRSATMKKVKSMLSDAAYRKGEAVLNGSVVLFPDTPVRKNEIILSSDLSSVDVDADVDLMLKKDGKKYIIKGTLSIKGDSDRVLSVTSGNLSVNDTYYRVSLKYRLTKVE